jgi:TatD DNase family protein
MIDSHTHLDYFTDPDEMVMRAREAGVIGIVSVGCGIESIRATLDIARRHPGYSRVAAGVHPQAAREFDMRNWDELEALCSDELVCAIGETGFDLYRDYGTLDQQAPVFEAQAALARNLGKPLVIHTRAAEQHTIDMLDRHARGINVVLHCFSLTDHVDTVLDRGWYCSFAGNSTYPSAQPLRDAACRVPLERLLVETDAPYLAPVPFRGTRNEPSYVVHTGKAIADARGIDVAELASTTTSTACELFGFELAATTAR